MNYKRAVEEIVTNFLLNTCRLRPQLSKYAVQAAMRCVKAATERSIDDAEADHIPLITGSVSEFYIEPMLPHVGDIDVMFHWSTWLAIPRGHPPPTQLPAEFHNYVHVGEIIDSHLPGYVYLKLRYLLTECVDDDLYKAVEYEEELYVSLHLNDCDIGDLFSLGFYHVTKFSVHVVCRGRHKPLIGHHDTESTAGQTQQLLIVLSATDVMWLVWHIVSVDNMNGWASISLDFHSHEQKSSC